MIIEPRFKTGRLRPFLLLLSDAVCLSATTTLVFWCYKLLGGRYSMSIVLHTWPILVLMIGINLCAKLYCGNLFYPGLAIHPVEELRRLTLSCLGSFLAFFAWLTLSRHNLMFSRVALFFSGLLSMLLIPAGRIVVRYILWKCHWGYIPAAIMGDAGLARLVVDRMSLDNNCILEVKASCCGEELNARIPDFKQEELHDFSCRHHISYLIYCVPQGGGELKIDGLLPAFLHVLVVNNISSFPVLWSYPVSFYRYFSFEVSNTLLHREGWVQKRVMEIFFTVLALIILFVPGLLIALLIKLTSRGPVFYRANRIGKNGRPIEVLKFRTMRVDADRILEKVLEQSPELKAQWEQQFKLKRDPRVTPIGAFLRKTSLDELPQFWNILRGEMALIGPRPIVQEEVKYYGKHFATFSSVKPGISGLWQVTGRSDIGYDERVGLDVFYVRNWSFWMDYYIFFRTFFVVLLGRGAY